MNSIFKKYRNKFKSSILIAFILVITIITVAFIYTVNLNHFLDSETKTYLQELSQQSSATAKCKLEGDFSTLDALAVYISEDSGDNILNALSILAVENNQSSFKRMGIITPDGKAYTTDGHIHDFSDRDYFKKALQNGETTISDVLLDKIDGQPIFVYASPISKNDNVIGVIFANNTIETYKTDLSITSFNGNGYSYIIKNDGTMLISSNHSNADPNIKNIFDLQFKDDQTREDFKNALAHNDFFTAPYSKDGESRYLSSSPIGINDWNLISVVPESIVSEKTNSILLSTIIIWTIILFFFSSLLIYIQKHQQKSKDTLARLAYEDKITGFSSWNKFLIDADYLIKNFGYQHYAMVAFDIDKFKVINDLYGFKQGNALLSQLAQELAKNLTDKETFCRITSDDFAILISYQNTNELKNRIQKINHQSLSLSDMYTFTLSFGIYLIDDDSLSLNHIFDRADMARKTTKSNNGNGITYFDTVMRNKIIDEKEIENEMSHALEVGQFKVYLQPKYSLSTMKPMGAEALVRWEHPTKGLILPGNFIPLFEKNNFITKLDFYVFETVCQKQREWMNLGYTPLIISSNFSRKHLKNRHLIENIQGIADKYQVPTKYLELEVTESAAFENMEVLTSVFKRLKRLNFNISIDDFGTGYSSLNLLKELPVDILKIDKEFFSETDNSERSKQVVKSVILMAQNLDIKVVAEGVETKEQINFLLDIGCDIVQGFYFARPMPIDDYAKLIYPEAVK